MGTQPHPSGRVGPSYGHATLSQRLHHQHQRRNGLHQALPPERPGRHPERKLDDLPGGDRRPDDGPIRDRMGPYSILDWWSVIIAVEGGSTPGIYQNSGTTPFPTRRRGRRQPTPSDVCSCPGRRTATASTLAPGCHDASCTVAGKMNSATMLSPTVGQPNSTTVSLPTDVPGRAVSRPLVVDATSSRVDGLPPRSDITWSPSRPPFGLNAAPSAKLPAGSSTAERRPVARSSTLTLHVAPHGGVDAISAGLAAMTASNVRPAFGSAGFQSLSACGPVRWLSGASSRPRSVAW